MLPVIAAARDSSSVHPVVVSTGQHADLVRQVLGLRGIEPDVTFEWHRAGYGLNDLVAHVLTSFDAWFRERFGEPVPPEQARYADGYPAACFVHGDTSSAAAAALAAFHLRLPVVHVEAGLRTGDTLTPFPEELNRQLISRIAALHLAPTYENKINLMAEHLDPRRIFVTGNTSIDTLQWAAGTTPPHEDEVSADEARVNAYLDEDPSAPVLVVTAHRRENWGAPLARIADAVSTLSARYPHARIVVATHPNQAVASTLTERLAPTPEGGHRNILLTPPLDYLAFARLLGRATLALSDSGGVQEEAPAVGTPVLCLRESTERTEGVKAGTVTMVGTDPDVVVAQVARLLDHPDELARRTALPNPYGDGHASQRILAVLDHIVYAAPIPAPFDLGVDRGLILSGAGVADPVAEGWVGPWSVGGAL